MEIYNLRCESVKNPMGLSIRQPRLTWNLRSVIRGAGQKAFRIQIEKESVCENGRTEQVLDTGRVESSETMFILDGISLESRTRYFWNVEVTGLDGRIYRAVQGAWFEMGLLEKEDWKARWIEPEQHPVYKEEFDISKELPFLRTFDNQKRRWLYEPEIDNYAENGSVMSLDINEDILYPSPLIRKKFTARKEISRARIYATAHGIYRFELNGKRVGDYELAPEATSYEGILQVQAYDVTDLLEEGENVLGAAVADGWWAGRLGFPGESARFGDMLGILVQMEIVYEDGTIQTVGSDRTFVSTTNGPRRYADMFIGEKYDCHMEKKGWSTAAFDDSDWTPVNEADYGFENLVGQNAQPVRILDTFPVVRTYISPKGEHILDFGQVLSGNAVMRLKGKPDATVRLKYFEEPDKDGNYINILTGYNSQMIDTIVLDEKGEGIYDPWFTTHGYRYICVECEDGKAEISDVQGRLIASDVPVMAEIETSNKKLNRLQKNIEWTFRTNMVSILGDNPDRERSGWSGDTQMIAPTCCYNIDSQALFRRWLIDMACDQGENGEIPAIIPHWHNSNTVINHSMPGWGDVAVIMPWHMYQMYGDKRFLEDSYPMMQKWLELEKYRAESANPVSIGEITPEREKYLKYLWNSDWSFGDWLTPSACYDEKTGKYIYGKLALCHLTGSYYYAYSTEIMRKTAAVLGKKEDEKMYADLNAKIREAAAKELYERGKFTDTELMGAPILGLHMHLCPEEARGELLDKVIELVNKKGMDAGFSSALVLPKILCENGYSDKMYEFLLNEKFPSWLYEVDHGATTMWEAMWAIQPDGTRGDTSYDQPAYCSIGGWMIEGMCGISAAEPGFRKVKIRPYFTDRLAHVRGRIVTEQGPVLNSWEHCGKDMVMKTEIPANTTGEIFIEHASKENLKETAGDMNGFEGMLNVTEKDGGVLLQVASGSYEFRWTPVTRENK